MDNNLTLLPKKNIKIRKASLELFKLNNEYKEYEKKYKQRKEELQNIIKAGNLSEFALETDNGNLKVKYIETNRVVWDIEKLKSKLDKKVLNEILVKNYSINNLEGLIKYLKSCGVDPKKFKKFINVETKVDNKKVDELGQLGEIFIDDLKDCYTLEKISEYVKFYEINSDEEE